MATTSPSSALAAQRERALKAANEVRSKRSQVWKRWRDLGRCAASLEAATMIESPPDWMGHVLLGEFIGHLPTFGRILYRGGHGGERKTTGAKTRQWLRELDLDPLLTLERLTPRQRGLVAEQLRLYADPAGWSIYRADLRR